LKKKSSRKKILGSAQNLKRKTKKIVDEVLLKFVGLNVLARAQAMTQSLRNAASPSKRSVAKSSKVAGAAKPKARKAKKQRKK
jgi:hypothetical protein